MLWRLAIVRGSDDREWGTDEFERGGSLPRQWSAVPVLGGLLLTAGPAGALTTITVTSNGDAGGPCTSFPTSCTLRQAFEAADAGGPAQGDDVEFVIQPAVGTISLASACDL